MSARDVEVLIANVTEQTIGIRISPHLFRTADATTAAEAAPNMPHLASALLGHKDTRITEEHYNRASSLNAGNRYADVILRKHYRQQDRHTS
jgi:integrase